MTYTRGVYYQILLTSISTGLLWGVELEKGCKRSVVSKPNELLQIECTDLPKMNLPSDVRSLVVQGDLRVINKEVLETSFMLQRLNVSNCNITFIQDGAFCKMEQLMILILTNNQIEYIEENTFSNLKLLTELHIDGNNLKVIIPGSLKETVYLQILNLQNNQLLEIPAELPKNLVILNLTNNDIEYIDMKDLHNMGNLEILSLGNNSIKSWPKDDLSLPSLRYLSLGSSLTSAQITGFSYPKLKHLHLSANLIDNTNFHGITITKVESLKELVLENYTIYDLQFLNHLNNLTTLHFKSITYLGNDITLLPPNLTQLYLETSPEIAKLFLNSEKMFLQLSKISLKNSNITVLGNSQAERLMKTVNSLDISQNPLICLISEWSWILETVKLHPSFLIDKDNVICNTPPEVKGKRLLSVFHDSLSSEEQRNITFISIMEEYVAEYRKEKKKILKKFETINNQQQESKRRFFYVTLVTLTIVGTLFLFIHLCHKKKNYRSEQGNITIEYTHSKEQINFRKTGTYAS